MEKFAVIVAGGSGSRMGNATPKQFLEVGGKPLLIHTIQAFLQAYADMRIVVVLPALHQDIGKQLIDQAFSSQHGIQITAGGATRFESVRNGLQLVPAHAIVFVHDAVRCMVSPTLIKACYTHALEKGSAIPVVSVKDSIRRITSQGSEIVNREELRAVQTPQTFKASILKDAFLQDYQDSFTDEASVVEYKGGNVALIDGEETNIKVTYPADLLMAEQFFIQQSSSL